MMTSSTAVAPTRSLRFTSLRLLRLFLLALTPDLLLSITLFILLLLYGGHRQSYIISKNPYCTINTTSTSTRTSGPPKVIIQLSDLHVRDTGTSKVHLTNFVDNSLPVWAPVTDAVVVTGDLVNAIEKQPYPYGTRSVQLNSEWRWLDKYSKHVNSIVPWLVTHGNHDTFGAHPLHHQVDSEYITNLTSIRFEKQQLRNQSARVKIDHFASSKLSFIGLDLTQPHPIHRPLNFFGDISNINLTNEYTHDSNDHSQHVLMFSHYPSSILKNGQYIHSFASNSQSNSNTLSKPKFSAYLSGHLHTLYGLTPDGLSAVSSVSGALELEAADMVSSGAFRVLVMHGDGLLAFKNLLVNTTNEQYIAQMNRSVLVFNPPTAGLCSAGAGTAALQSTHVQVLSMHIDLEEEAVEASVDGVDHLGTFKKLPCDSDDDGNKEVCKHLYGVEWNASRYSEGVHTLYMVRDKGNDQMSFKFSLDGSMEMNIKQISKRLIHSTFALSNFQHIMNLCAISSLLLCMLCCLPGLGFFTFTSTTKPRSLISLVSFIYSISILVGVPLLVAKNLSAVDHGWGFVSIYKLRVPSGVFDVALDAPFIFARCVLWTSLLPCCVVDFFLHSNLVAKDRGAGVYAVLSTIMLVALRKCWSWTMEIAGAHGQTAAILSPGCLPLYILCTVYMMTCVSSLIKRIPSIKKRRKITEIKTTHEKKE